MTNQPTIYDRFSLEEGEPYSTHLEPHDHVCRECHQIQRQDCHDQGCASVSDVQLHGYDVYGLCARCEALDQPYAEWLANQAELAPDPEPCPTCATPSWPGRLCDACARQAAIQQAVAQQQAEEEIAW